MQAWIKEARTRKGMSQRELAKAVGVSQPTIALLETADILPGVDLDTALRAVLEEKSERGKMLKQTQNDRVLEFRKKHGKITQQDAVGFKCFRLSARIADLKKQGYAIVTERKGFRNEYGSGNYAEYHLAEV